MEAQRYPDDFDGIVAGAPAFNFTQIAASFIRNTQTTYPSPASVRTSAVSRDNLVLLSGKVLDACDAGDGVKDGVVDDPRDCRFDASSLPACPGDQGGPQCVTAAQRAAIARIYTPVAIAGKTVYAGQPVGGESEAGGWTEWITGPDERLLGGSGGRVPSLQFGFGTEFFKYFVFSDPAWDYSRYDLSSWERDTRLVGTVLNADNPDLGPFAARRGKLLLWHGWSDAALNAVETIGYYDRVLARAPALRDAARLFMMPGVQHCGGGSGPGTVDWLHAIGDWVERGQAPERLVAAKRGPDGAVVRTRPLCAYPQRAVYSGTGSIDEAASFVCRGPSPTQ
jgi:feruloyl esterase